MTQILYYLFIKPLSLLPLRVLYVLSDFLYLVLYKMIGYRKKVVFTNLRNSFPEKNEKEIKEIADKFYANLCDLVVESVRFFSISEQEIKKRFIVRNPELCDKFAEEGRNIVLTSGHLCNWEIVATSINLWMKHWPLGVHSPIKNKFLYKKMTDSRGKFGTGLISTTYFKSFVEEKLNDPNINTALILVGDQAPSSAKKKLYWTTFLHQDTPVMLGTEKYAKEYDMPVVFIKMYKVKRGYYEGEFELLTDTPKETNEFEITEMHTRTLERIIRETPESWLWSHRRWKRKRGGD